MTDEQLATAIPRMDQAAYLAGLIGVSEAENRECGLVPPARRREFQAMMKKRERQNAQRRESRHQEVLRLLPIRQAMTTREAGEIVGKSTSAMSQILPALERAGEVFRHPKRDRESPFVWERVR